MIMAAIGQVDRTYARRQHFAVMERFCSIRHRCATWRRPGPHHWDVQLATSGCRVSSRFSGSSRSLARSPSRRCRGTLAPPPPAAGARLICWKPTSSRNQAVRSPTCFARPSAFSRRPTFWIHAGVSVACAATTGPQPPRRDDAARRSGTAFITVKYESDGTGRCRYRTSSTEIRAMSVAAAGAPLVASSACRINATPEPEHECGRRGGARIA